MAGTDLVTTGARALIIFETAGSRETIIDAELVTDAIKEVGVASDETAAANTRLGSAFKRTSVESKLLGAGMMVAGKGVKWITEGLLAAGVGAIWTGIKFQQAMAGVNSVARTNAKGMKALQSDAILASTQTKFSASQSAEAEMLLARAGIHTKGVMQALIPTLNLATAAQADVGETAGLMGEVMNAFDLHGNKATLVANQLAYAVQGGAMSLDDLNQAMKYVGAAAYATNQPLSGVIGLLKAMALHGVKGSLAGTTLRFSMTRLIKPVKAVTDGLALINVRQDQLKSGKGLKPMADIFATIYQHLQALDKNSQKTAIDEIFGVRAFTGISAIMNQGPKAFQQFIQQAQAGTAVAKTMADKINNTIENQLLRFYHILDDIGIMIFMSFAPALTHAFATLNKAIAPIIKHMPELQAMVAKGDWRGAAAKIDELVGANGRLSTVIYEAVDAAATLWNFFRKIVYPFLRPLVIILAVSLYLAFKGIVLIMKALNKEAWLVVPVLQALVIVFAALRIATLAMTVASWLLNASFYADPIFWIIVGLVALVAAIIIAWQHFKLFRDIVFGILDFAKNHWRLIVLFLAGPVGEAAILIVDHFDTIKRWFWDIFNDLEGWGTELESFLQHPFEVAAAWIMKKLDAIVSKWDWIKKHVTGPWDWATGTGSGSTTPRAINPTNPGGADGLGTNYGGASGQGFINQALHPNMPLKVLDPITAPNKDLFPGGNGAETIVNLYMDRKKVASLVAKHGQNTKARVK